MPLLYLFHAALISLLQVLFILVNKPVRFCLMGWLAILQKSCTETSQLVQFNLIIKTESLSSTGTTLFN